MTAGFVINTWKYDSPQRPSPPLWDLGHLCGFSVRSELTPRCPVVLRELGTVSGDPACLESGTNLNWLFSTICVYYEGQALRLYYVGQSTQNPFPILCIVRIIGRIRYWLNGLWLILILTLKCCLSWGKSSAVSSPEHGDPVTRIFSKDHQSWVQKVCTFVVNGVHFPPECFTPKDLYTYISSPL